MTNKDTVLAWHFLTNEERTGHGNLKVEVGQTLTVEGTLEVCGNGLHGSLRALDALSNAPGSIVCRVEHAGKILHGDDQLCSSERTCLWMADASRTLHEFAIWCAEQALASIEHPDPRSLNALAVKRRWLDGDATDGELNAARAAAYGTAIAVTEANGSTAVRSIAWAIVNAATRGPARILAKHTSFAVRAMDLTAVGWSSQNTELERRLMLLAPEARA